MRAFTAALSVPWAIQEDSLRDILEITTRTNLNPEAVAARLGRPLDNSQTVSMRDGVAVLPINGPICRYANLFSEVSGSTSTEILARDFQAALEDPNVESILLQIDSPGGEVTGIGELAGMIYAARKKKPVTAYVEGLGASAAYWLASAADEVVASPTAMLGSIGVVMARKDTREKDAREGVRHIEFVSSQSPNKRPDDLTEEGAAQIQALVDATAEVFVSEVARNRGVSAEKVLSDFGAGGMKVGEAAVKAGLADRLGTFEGVLRELQARAQRHRRGAAVKAESATAPPGSEPMKEIEELKADLAAAQSANEALKGDLAAKSTELQTAQQRAIEADERAAKAEVLAKVGAQALEDVKGEYIEACVQLGRGTTEATEVANLLAKTGNYARLKELRAEAKAEVFRRFPTGTSGDTSPDARKSKDVEDPGEVLTSIDRANIKDLAKSLNLTEAQAEEKYLAVKRERLFAA